MLGVWTKADIKENDIWKNECFACNVCNKDQHHFRIDYIMSTHVSCSCVSCGERYYWYTDKFLETHTKTGAIITDFEQKICDCEITVLMNRGCLCGNGRKK